MRSRLILLIVLASILWAPLGSTAAAHSSGRVFYVSARGNDRASGLSPADAWRSVHRVDAARLRPGDRVLFRGNDTFAGTTLMPRASGTEEQPIVFGAYGRGFPILQARESAVFLAAGVSHLTFVGLRMTTGPASPASILASAATGRGSTDIRIAHCRLFATGGAAIVSKKAADTGWQITRDRISRTGDSGLILLGTGAQIRDNVIEDVGLSKSIPWGRHGIYMKAADATIVGNVIRRFHDDGISLRFPDARVVGNTIDDGGIGIAYFSYDSVAGVSLVQKNTITRVRFAGFYYDPTARGGGSYPRESFELSDNVIQVSSGAGIDVQGATHASMRIYSNDVGGAYNVAIVANSPDGGSYFEEKNTLGGVPLVRWNGQDENVTSYRTASGQGLSDVFAS
jgi:Right handed beta helix region